jgi:hypothetical protein
VSVVQSQVSVSVDSKKKKKKKTEPVQPHPQQEARYEQNLFLLFTKSARLLTNSRTITFNCKTCSISVAQ